MEAEEAALLEALQRDIVETKGVAPYNFYPFITIDSVSAVRRVSYNEERAKAKSTVLMETTIPAPSEKPNTVPLLCAFLKANDRAEFLPWSQQTGVVLQMRTSKSGAPITLEPTRLHPSLLKTKDIWGYKIPPTKAGTPMIITYVDTRTASNIKAATPFSVVVVLRASSKVLSSEDTQNCLIQRLPQVSNAELQKQTAVNSVEGLSVTGDSAVLQVRDPATWAKIKIPIKSRSCTHLQCLDLLEVLKRIEEHKHSTKGIACPVCGNSFYLKDLVLDTTFRVFLKDAARTKTDSITISADEYESRYGEENTALKRVHKILSADNAGDVWRLDAMQGSPLAVVVDVEDIEGMEGMKNFVAKILKPFLNVKHFYVRTGTVVNFMLEEAEPCKGVWRTFSGNPTRYFVKDAD